MHKILMLVLMVSMPASALAINKCDVDGKISYSDAPCSNGKGRKLEASSQAEPLLRDVTSAKQQAVREKNELRRLEAARQKREAQEEKERLKIARAGAVKQKRCATLALEQKWAEEDAAAAIGKSAEKAKRNAGRKTEKFEMECGR